MNAMMDLLFPQGHNWEAIVSKSPQDYPTIFDWPVVAKYLVAFTLGRYVIEKFFLIRFACRSLGIPDSIQDAPFSAQLKPHKESLLRLVSITKRPTETQVLEAVGFNNAKCSDAKLWLREQTKANKKRLSLRKYTEAAWRFFFYTCLCIIGWRIVVDKPWLWEPSLCYQNYPDIEISPWHKQYYLIELSVYLHLLVSQFFDIRREDFWEMFIHHIATIVLIGFSYLTNQVNMGTLILVVHDTSDVFLESAKLANYNKWKRSCDFLFTCFAASFFVTRLVIFPFHLIKSFAYDTDEIFHGSFGYWFSLVFLGILQCLHIFWFYLISRMIIRMAIKGEVEKDIRSESNDSDKND